MQTFTFKQVLRGVPNSAKINEALATTNGYHQWLPATYGRPLWTVTIMGCLYGLALMAACHLWQIKSDQKSQKYCKAAAPQKYN